MIDEAMRQCVVYAECVASLEARDGRSGRLRLSAARSRAAGDIKTPFPSAQEALDAHLAAKDAPV